MNDMDVAPVTDTIPKIYLSERNLRILLSKLERQDMGEQTFCSIIKHQQPSSAYQQSMDAIMVVAVPDHEYYGAQNRLAGDMHPADETRISDDSDWFKPGLSE